MLFRSTDLLNDFERLTKGLNLGPEFDRTVDDLSTKFTSTFAGAPNLDVVRSDDRFALFIDLPGVDPTSVDVTVDGRTLTISATREFEVAEGHDTFMLADATVRSTDRSSWPMILTSRA